ncbi:MAG TPA: hypothetical protein VJO33_12885 [Gemmatimonadaceae bacterium]|nr:hypothetical protein [Gemmatimonadaceae bacterium]
MNKLMSMAMVPLLLVVTRLPAQERQKTSMRHRFVGAWRLVALEEQGPDGEPHRCDCTGMFVFTHDGHAAVQVLTRSPRPGRFRLNWHTELAHNECRPEKRSPAIARGTMNELPTNISPSFPRRYHSERADAS